MKRLVVGGGAVLAMVFGAASAQAAGLPRFHANLIVPGQSVGGVSVGERAATAINAWGGNKACPMPATLSLCTWGSSSTGGTGYIELSFAKGKVNQITLQLDTNRSGEPIFRGPLMRLKTKKGIGLKSTALRLEEAYPGQLGENGFGETLGSGAHTTTFTTSGGKFYSIVVGAPPSS